MGKNFESDLYVIDEKQLMEYRHFNLEGIIDFNHAALQRPFGEVYEFLNSTESQNVHYNDGRAVAAKLVNLKDPSRVIFGRNTTEALSFAYWLADVDTGNVICTDAENDSIIRIFQEHRDHGNTKGKDGWSTFPDAIVAEDFEGLESIVKTPTKVVTIPVINDNNYDGIIDRIDENIKLVVFSHVRRIDGYIADIGQMARRIKEKNPNTYVAVDGAQALGNLPAIDFNRLEKAGIDFYAATPHKTLGSYPVGILYVSNRVGANIQKLERLAPELQIIMDGMLDESHSIAPNVNSRLNPKRMASLVKAVEVLENSYLSGNDFSRKSEHTRRLKNYFISKLSSYDATVLEESTREYSPAMLSFSFNNQDNRSIVEKLQRHKILTSYIAETNSIRLSFDISNSNRDVDKYFETLSKTR
jgi:selenocysteine lyase/cysteine desulfurase